MFSLENFYYILYSNLLKPANINPYLFRPFGSTASKDLQPLSNNIFVKHDKKIRYFNHVNPRLIGNNLIFWDQEPFFEKSFNQVVVDRDWLTSYKRFGMIVVSEHSAVVDKVCKDMITNKWYYFFHGFAALDWYRDYQYFPELETHISKLFISFNRLVTKDRSYRLNLVANLLERDLVKNNSVSLSLNDHGWGSWKDELQDPNSKLSPQAKKIIVDQIGNLSDSLIVDQESPQGSLSAYMDYDLIKLQQQSLWHLVTETVFYYDKLHLTEKIFKPIVCRRPFILVGAPGNLAYLKSYGFKTFDHWIDESYDLELDHDRRISMIVDQMENLSKLSIAQLNSMYQEMKPVLEYNFNHLYGSFKKIIADELVNNFESAIAVHNHSSMANKIDVSNINFQQVKTILSK
jgi:hypothetical protein